MAGGVGAFGVAFGTVTGIVALSKTDSGSYGTLSAVGFGVGVVGLGAGAYLWFHGAERQRGGASGSRRAATRKPATFLLFRTRAPRAQIGPRPRSALARRLLLDPKAFIKLGVAPPNAAACQRSGGE